MKRGHVTGRKVEKKGSTDWYKSIEAAHLARIEAEWQVRRESAMKECGNTIRYTGI